MLLITDLCYMLEASALLVSVLDTGRNGHSEGQRWMSKQVTLKLGTSVDALHFALDLLLVA